MPRGRLYNQGSQFDEAISKVVELHLDNNASAQVSAQLNCTVNSDSFH